MNSRIEAERLVPASTERKQSAAEIVRMDIEREISEGILTPGDSLDEENLAARYGVSRTPVREALLNLSVRGLVTITPRVGIYVSRLSLSEILSLIELLAELEAVCVKLATRRHSPEEAEALVRIHEESKVFERSGDAQGYAHSNAEFHEILYRACRNPSLASHIAHVRSRTRVYRRSVFQNQVRIRRSREDHGRILEAMFAGNPSAAADAMLEHISGGGRDLADLVSSLPSEMMAVDADYPGRRVRARAQ